MTAITIERLPTSAFIRDAKSVEEYRDVNKLHPLFDSIGYGNGVVLVGPKGCLAGDSYIQYAVFGSDGALVNKKGGSIELLYRRFNHLPQMNAGPQQRDGDLAYFAPSMKDDGTITRNRIRAVICTGDKECFELVTCGGERLVATADHEFFVGDGYARLDALVVGSAVFVHRNKRPDPTGLKKQEYRKELTVKYHPYAPCKEVNGYQYRRLVLARGAYEAHLNALSLSSYVARLNAGQLEGLRFLSPGVDVHHRDEDWSNNAIENLEIVEHSQHASRHAAERDYKQLRFVVVADEVLSIHAVGKRVTYDVQMDDPYRNVVAEGLVVHNCGKSLSIASYAASKGIPLVTFDCSEDVRRAQLLGAYIIRGNETPFVLGPIPTAIEIANETGVCILVLEEINTLTPQMQKVLNAVSDFRRRVEINEAKVVYALKPEARLLIAGTMNHAGYGGVYDLNEDLKSRLNLLPLDYPSSAEEQKILAAYQKRHSLQVTTSLITGVLTLAHETRQQAMEYALSTRDLTQLLYNMDKIGVPRSLWIMSGKFEGRDRETFMQRVKSVFGVDAANVG